MERSPFDKDHGFLFFGVRVCHNTNVQVVNLLGNVDVLQDLGSGKWGGRDVSCGMVKEKGATRRRILP